jgi:uncharacterized protein (DUF983 family)
MPNSPANAYLIEDALTSERPTWPAIRRGLTCRCPKCGEVYTHQRADDGPAYLTILIVGHLMAPLMLYVFVEWRPEPAVMATFFTIGTALLSLVLLPRLKGAMVALQWAKRMHGFSTELPSDPSALTHV